MSEIKVGSKVKVINGGCHYPMLTDRAASMGLTKYNPDVADFGALMDREGETFTVVAYAKYVGIEDSKGHQYIIDPEGVVVVEEAPKHLSAGILEPFDRVVTKYGTFIVADFKNGRYLLGNEGNWLDINEFNATPVLAVYKAPWHLCDVFDFSLNGEKKWEHPDNAKRDQLAAKIAKLQEQLAEANEELDALN